MIVKIAKKTLPISVFNGCKRLLGLPIYGYEVAGEKGSEFYDKAFMEDSDWRDHYTQSEYYFCWTVILDRLRRGQVRTVLEIGCGSGQLAMALRDAEIVNGYCGFDFSEARLKHARSVCPEFEFHVADAYTTELFSTCDYDTAIATEFLEHVEGDLEVLSKLSPGSRFIGTVPNFPYVSHVRHFASCKEVFMRYEKLFVDLDVVAIPANITSKTFFLLEGIKK